MGRSGMRGGGGGVGQGHHSSSPISRPSKLNNPTICRSFTADSAGIWSKILLRNRADSGQSSAKLCILIRPTPTYWPNYMAVDCTPDNDKNKEQNNGQTDSSFRRALTASVGAGQRAALWEKECPFSGMVWRRVPENGAWSVPPSQTPSTGLRHPSFNHCRI